MLKQSKISERWSCFSNQILKIQKKCVLKTTKDILNFFEVMFYLAFLICFFIPCIKMDINTCKHCKEWISGSCVRMHVLNIVIVQIVHMVVPSTLKERITLDMHSRCSINPRNGKNSTRIEPVLNELITVS